MKIEYWEVMFFVLFIFFALLCIIYYKEVYNVKVDLGEFQMPKLQFDALMEAVKDQPQVQVCSIEEGKCATLRRIKE